MTIYNDIRAALEITLNDISDIPTIKFQNTSFEPSTGTPFLVCNFTPTSRRPSEVGSNPFNRFQGLFSLFVHTPENTGSKQNQDICNKVIQAFPEGTHDLTFNDKVVRIEYTEQLPSFEDSPWFVTPINVAWYAYDKQQQP